MHLRRRCALGMARAVEVACRRRLYKAAPRWSARVYCAHYQAARSIVAVPEPACTREMGSRARQKSRLAPSYEGPVQ